MKGTLKFVAFHLICSVYVSRSVECQGLWRSPW